MTDEDRHAFEEIKEIEMIENDFSKFLFEINLDILDILDIDEKPKRGLRMTDDDSKKQIEAIIKLETIERNFVKSLEKVHLDICNFYGRVHGIDVSECDDFVKSRKLCILNQMSSEKCSVTIRLNIMNSHRDNTNLYYKEELNLYDNYFSGDHL